MTQEHDEILEGYLEAYPTTDAAIEDAIKKLRQIAQCETVKEALLVAGEASALLYIAKNKMRPLAVQMAMDLDTVTRGIEGPPTQRAAKLLERIRAMDSQMNRSGVKP
jgi:hypothetical protein